ncbi:lytic transglycosylase domain-containing protein [Helcococcus kunzii]|uniref:lytic transglycosylase domain-containing protein n=1 Tax=Helcococcus kunzii TaxID=40091 RepID=UPI0024ADBA41|nr:lytic transglycosylase domain-containing protein [Helcococcus kunzii]
MKVFKRLLVFLLVLAIVIFIGIYFLVFFLVRDNHKPYMGYIEKYSQENKLDEKLITALVKTESSFNPNAHSKADARGLMQLVPETGKWVASQLDEEFKEENLKDPETNIRYGTYYFKHLLNQFKSVDYAIIAYNAGPTNVKKWIDGGILTGSYEDYENIPIQEAKDYIQKVKKQYNLNKKIYNIYYKNPDDSRFVKAFKVLGFLVSDIFN